VSLPVLNFPQADVPLPAQNPDALVAEIERLRRFEASAEHARSSLETAIVAAVERERAAIVAWLRAVAPNAPTRRGADELAWCANAIERGEHRREEKP
jgi:hypothetical protein